MKEGQALAASVLFAVAFCASILVGVNDAYAISANEYCTCTSSCGPGSGETRPWCRVSSSCAWNDGTSSGYKWSYCNSPVKSVVDCTACPYSSSGTRSGQSVNWCCLDSSLTCVSEYLGISNNYPYCPYSLPYFSYSSGSPNTPTNAPTDAPTDAPSPTSNGASGTCLNSLYSEACQAIRDGYSTATLGLCQINEQCSAITCSTPTIPYVGKKSFSLAYDACKNDFAMTVDGITEVWDLDTAVGVGFGISLKAVNKKTDTSCSSYDVISFSLAVSVPVVGQVTIPIQFPVGPSSCGMPKWQLYTIIGGCVAAVLVVVTVTTCYCLCRKNNNANIGTTQSKTEYKQAVATVHPVTAAAYVQPVTVAAYAQPVALVTVPKPH